MEDHSSNSELIGLEIELLMLKNNLREGVSWQEWTVVAEKIRKMLEARGYSFKEKRDFMTSALLGFEIDELGTLAVDSGSTIAEFSLKPAETLERLRERAEVMLAILAVALKEINACVFMSSHAPFLPSEEHYLKTVAPKSIYPIVRKEWGWKHYELHLTASIQPALDVRPQELPAYVNAISVTTPIYIVWFGGSSHVGGMWEYRLRAWEKMLPEHDREESLGPILIEKPEDYWKRFLSVRAKVLPLAGDYKAGSLMFFPLNIRARDLIYREVQAFVVDRVENFHADEYKTRPGIYTPRLFNPSVIDWWVFWDVRWRWSLEGKTLSISNLRKSFVEIRHIGTPRRWESIWMIMESFLLLKKHAQQVMDEANRLGLLDENLIVKARKRAYETGQLDENFQQLAELLKKKRIIPSKPIHRA